MDIDMDLKKSLIEEYAAADWVAYSTRVEVPYGKKPEINYRDLPFVYTERCSYDSTKKLFFIPFYHPVDKQEKEDRFIDRFKELLGVPNAELTVSLCDRGDPVFFPEPVQVTTKGGCSDLFIGFREAEEGLRLYKKSGFGPRKIDRIHYPIKDLHFDWDGIPSEARKTLMTYSL